MPKRKRNPVADAALSLNKAGDEAIAEHYGVYALSEVPGGDTTIDTGKPDAFRKARPISRSHYWLKAYFALKASIVNYGVRLTPAQVKKKVPGQREIDKLSDWLDEPLPPPKFTGSPSLGYPNQAIITRRERVTKFIDEAVMEFLVMRNALAFWSDGAEYAVLLPPEACRYKDVLGIETLFYRHGLSQTDIQELDPAQQERFKKAEIAIGQENGEFFKVLKDERTGFGLAWPSLQPIFRVCSTTDSMEIGESAYAYNGRLKWRHHKVGHKIEGGKFEGTPVNFISKKRADQIHRVWDNKRGSMGDWVGNFDHDIEFPHEPIEYYKSEKWSSAEHRLVLWGGPVAQLLVATGQTPVAGLMKLLKAEILAERARLQDFLESVLNQAFAPTIPLKVGWSSMIFTDSRIEAETLKFGVTCGAVSQQTFREESGLDNAKEALRKEAEAAEAKSAPEKFRPAFDAAHGDVPPGGPQGGKPPGTQHKETPT